MSNLLWPIPLWTAVVAAGAIISLTFVVARLNVRRRQSTSDRIERALHAAGFEADGATFCVPAGALVLIVSSQHLAVVETPLVRLIQLTTIRQTKALKLYDGRPDRISLRIITRGDAESRKIVTQSLIAFTRLFIAMTAAHKPIIYVEEF